MLVDKMEINKKRFLSVFKDKFENFCKKAPIFIRYVIVGDTVILEKIGKQDYDIKHLFEYELNYQLNVQVNIAKIKEKLWEMAYPILIQDIVTYEDYTPQELNALVAEGKISSEDIDTHKKVKIHSVKWRIEKIIVDKNRLFVRNLETNILECFEAMSKSVFYFVKSIDYKEVDAREGFTYFSTYFSKVFFTRED